MMKLPGEAYLKSPDRSERVLIFGKSKEQIQIDLEHGISRFGGVFREPNYSEAYLTSAGILLENAKQINELDELGLPIFYLSRHAMELKIKDILSLAYEICDLRKGTDQISNVNQNIPTKGQLKRLNKCHKLRNLYNDLCTTLEELSVKIPNEYFLEFIELVERYEMNPTWSRYSKHERTSHVGTEVAVPIVGVVKKLEQLFRAIEFDAEGEHETLETELYYMFSGLTSNIESTFQQ